MAGIDDVLERLITDDAFRADLATDPDTALAGYDLTAEDRALLASQVSADAGQSGRLEGRTSKAGLFGLLGGLDEIADAVVAGDEPPAQADATGYDYPGDYARRHGGVTPAAADDSVAYSNTFTAIPDSVATGPSAAADADAAETMATDDADDQAGAAAAQKPTYLQVSLANVAISEYDAAPEPSMGADDLMQQPATPAASGGTMSTDNWDEPTAGDEGDGETTVVAGVSEEPSPSGEHSQGLWQINSEPDGTSTVNAADQPDVEMLLEAGASDDQTAAGDPLSKPVARYTFEDAWPKSAGDTVPDETITIHGPHDSAGAVEPGPPGSAQLADADPPAEPAAGWPARWELSALDASGAQAPPVELENATLSTDDQQATDDPDPDTFDVSELTQWAAGQADTAGGPADLGATPEADSGGADPGEGAAEPPAPDR